MVLFVAVSDGFAAECEPVTLKERIEAQQVAQQFVRRMQQTRDVAPLVDELFVPDFISHFTSDDNVSPSLYSRLSLAERRRWFIAKLNLSYLITLDVLSKQQRNYSEADADRLAFRSILPATLAEKFRDMFSKDGDSLITDYQKLVSFLVALEGALAEARVHLIKQGIDKRSHK